jgi:hypothetical protein
LPSLRRLPPRLVRCQIPVHRDAAAKLPAVQWPLPVSWGPTTVSPSPWTRSACIRRGWSGFRVSKARLGLMLQRFSGLITTNGHALQCSGNSIPKPLEQSALRCVVQAAAMEAHARVSVSGSGRGDILRPRHFADPMPCPAKTYKGLSPAVAVASTPPALGLQIILFHFTLRDS